MKMLPAFYSSLRLHLIDSGVESGESILGYSDAEIALAESNLALSFPMAYRLFLQNFGERANFHDSHEYQLKFLPDAQEIIQDIASRNELHSQSFFPFSQWQGYSVFCLKTQGDNDNPEVFLFVEGDTGLETYKYSSFTNWLVDRVQTYLNYLPLGAYKSEFLKSFLAESD